MANEASSQSSSDTNDAAHPSSDETIVIEVVRSPNSASQTRPAITNFRVVQSRSVDAEQQVQQLERLSHNPGLSAIENEQVDMAQQETDRLNETRGGLDDLDSTYSSDRLSGSQASVGDWESHTQGSKPAGVGDRGGESEEADSRSFGDSNSSDASETPSHASGRRPPVSTERVTRSDEASSPAEGRGTMSTAPAPEVEGQNVEVQQQQQQQQTEPREEVGDEDETESQGADAEQDEDEDSDEDIAPMRRGKRRRWEFDEEEFGGRESKRAR